MKDLNPDSQYLRFNKLIRDVIVLFRSSTKGFSIFHGNYVKKRYFASVTKSFRKLPCTRCRDKLDTKTKYKCIKIHTVIQE